MLSLDNIIRTIRKYKILLAKEECPEKSEEIRGKIREIENIIKTHPHSVSDCRWHGNPNNKE